jgi:hypothetical protein
MAIPAYSDNGGFVSAIGSVGSIVLDADVPATVNSGDLLVLFVGARATGITLASVPVGFTGGTVAGTSTQRLRYFYKIADGTEGGTTITYTATYTSGTPRGTAIVLCYTGTGLSSTIDAGSNTSGTVSTDAIMPDITTTASNSRAIACIITGNVTTIDDASGETGGDWIEVVAEGGTVVCMQIQHAEMASIGSITGGTATLGASNNWTGTGFAASEQPAGGKGFPFFSPTMLAHHIFR